MLDIYISVRSASTYAFCLGESQDWQGFLTCSLVYNLGQSEAPALVFESQGGDRVLKDGEIFMAVVSAS